jgi:hypothetical protein
MEENGSFLEGSEVHDTICENNFEFDFIIEPLENSNFLILLMNPNNLNLENSNLINFAQVITPSILA